MPSNHLILHCPLLVLPSVFPSIRVFSNQSALCIRWPKYRSFSFNFSPSNEHPGLISFRMDWLDLLAVQGTHKSLLQHHGSKASVLWHSAFFTDPNVQTHLKELSVGGNLRSRKRVCICKLHDPGKIMIPQFCHLLHEAKNAYHTSLLNGSNKRKCGKYLSTARYYAHGRFQL